MKSLIVSASILGISLFTSCGDKPAPKKDTTPKVAVRSLGGLKIAYFSNDSIKANFAYFVKEEGIIKKKQKAFESEVERRTKAYEAFITKKDAEARGGLLSQNEIAQVQQRAQEMQNQIMQYQQTEGAKIEELAMKSLETVNKKIEALGKKYCEKHQIDILLMHGPGGQINYINDRMDVTTEFVNFLNENQAQIEKELN
ncbi:MAG: OmpH family outer membrane protein [Crocinitomicaceae bacterium]|nr:OmpH family outer membrane protein [Crocinitomicaceae bacterium]MBP6033351.1 OmpH family outer membrane protein [Crocinitomicaceae bacterium]